MSDEEVIAVLKEDYQCLPTKKWKKSIPKEVKNLTPLTTGNQNVLIPLVAGLSGLAFGYDMGIGKPLTTFMKQDFTLNCHQENTILIVWFIGALLGGLFGGFSIDTFGRRFTMILSLIFLAFGSILSSLANHYILFLAARIICGFSGTISAMSHCIYMAEVSDKRKRGSNITLHQIGTASGLLLAIIIAATKGTKCQWRFIIGLTSVPALVACITIIIFLHRSPSFLLLKKLSNMPKHVNQLSASITAWCYILKMFVIMTIMLFLRQGTGRHQVLAYAPRLFSLLGMCPDDAEVAASIALGIIKVFSTSLALAVVERCGRRTALITSATICMTTISLLSLLATMDRGDDSLNLIREPCKNVATPNITESINNQNANIPIGFPPPFPLLPTPLAITAPNPKPWTQIKTICEPQSTSEGLTGGLQILAVITLFVYESAYALGIGPVPLLILCEVFPATIRGRSIGFFVIVLWISHIFISESIFKVTKMLTLAGAYLLYSFICLITIFYVFLFIPETKRKSLNQIAHELYRVSLKTRICENLKSLPLVCHIEWIMKYGDNSNNEQSTPI